MKTIITNNETTNSKAAISSETYKNIAGNIRKIRPDISNEKALEAAMALNTIIGSRYRAKKNRKPNRIFY